VIVTSESPAGRLAGRGFHRAHGSGIVCGKGRLANGSKKRYNGTRKDRVCDVFGPFSAGDSLRVYRLQRKGVFLDLQRALTRPYAPLREAWLAFLTQQAMGQPTYVLYDLHDGEGFVQVRYRPHQAAADVAFLAPALEVNQRAGSVWSRLLEGAGVEAGGRGIQRIFANLPGSGAEMEAFHQAGFTLYAEEDIYRLAGPGGKQAGAELPALRPQRPEDWLALQKLCVVITPRRVRQAEGGIAVGAGWERSCQRYVLPRANGDELAAMMCLCSGGTAHWLRVLIHPDAQDVADELFRRGLAMLAERSTKPVYCNVRKYEGGARAGLEAVGFEPHATRAMMVKHTVAWIKSPSSELVPVLKGSAELLPPAYHVNGEPEFQTANGRLVATRKT
jgi:hypothetical protein